MPDGVSRKPAHNAAQWRKRLRRELSRVGAADVSLYIDGPRGTARLRYPDHGREFGLGIEEALRRLRSLPDGAGVEQTAEVIARTEPGQPTQQKPDQLSGATGRAAIEAAASIPRGKPPEARR